MKRFQRAWEGNSWRVIPVRLATFACGILFVYLYAHLLIWINVLITPASEGLVVRPSMGLWVHLGIGLAVGLLLLALSYKASEFRRNGRGRWQPNVITRGVTVCVGLSLVLSALAVRKHLMFKDDGLVEQPEFSLRSTQFSYGDIAQVTLERYEIPEQKGMPAHPSPDLALLLTFRGHDAWALISEDFDIQEPERLAGEIARRARIPVVRSEEVLPTPHGYYLGDRALYILLLGTIVVTGCWQLFDLSTTLMRSRQRVRRR